MLPSARLPRPGTCRDLPALLPPPLLFAGLAEMAELAINVVHAPLRKDECARLTCTPLVQRGAPAWHFRRAQAGWPRCVAGLGGHGGRDRGGASRGRGARD